MIVEFLFAASMQAGSLPVQTVVKDGARESTRAAPRASAKAAHRVVVDAGHGGIDPGGQMHDRASMAEKDIALGVAMKLGAALRARGIEVTYTRTKDTLIALEDRGHMANSASGDLFISLHVNAANPRWKRPTSARGFETYFLAEARTDDARRVEQMENEAVRFQAASAVKAGDPLSFILSDMIQNQHLRESSDLAEVVQRHLAGVHPGPDRGVKQAGFTVLVGAFMPAILVELGFGTNAEEATFLTSASKQRALAEAIADATAEYLERYERRVGGASSTHD